VNRRTITILGASIRLIVFCFVGFVLLANWRLTGEESASVFSDVGETILNHEREIKANLKSGKIDPAGHVSGLIENDWSAAGSRTWREVKVHSVSGTETVGIVVRFQAKSRLFELDVNGTISESLLD